MDVIVHEIEHGGLIIGIEDRTCGLYGEGSLEFVRGGLFSDIEQQVALDPFIHGIDMIGRDPVVHKLVYGILKGLENLLVAALNLLTDNLYIASQLLCHAHDWQNQQAENN